MTNPVLTQETLQQMYSVDGKTVLQIALALDAPVKDVYDAIQSFGLNHLWTDPAKQTEHW